MASALYHGVVVHRRFGEIPHALRYRMMMALLDLDELDDLDHSLRLFSHGRFNLFSFHDCDHLAKTGFAKPGSAKPGSAKPGSSDPGPAAASAAATLRGTIEAHLAAAGLSFDGGAIRLLSMPRILGYAFNPLSVYFCHRADGTLGAILYEVRNTFGQRHTYVIPVAREAGGGIRQRCEKVFYVSPFLDMDMTYDFRIVPPGDRVSIAVDGSRAGRRMIAASFSGQRRPLTDAALLRAFLAHPTLTFAVVAGIHWEALKLWLKGVGLRSRPAPPDHPVTIIPPREV